MADKELNFKITGDTSGLSKATRQTKTDLRQASSVVRRSRTEYEKYADELEKVNRLEKRGALDANQAAKARQSLATNRGRLPARGAFGELAGAAGFGSIVGAAGPLAAGIAGLTIATRNLTNIIERSNQLRDTARTTGLSAEFILALQRRGRRDRVTPRTSQAVEQAVSQRRRITGQSGREALQGILAPSADLPERQRRMVLQQMIPGAGADVTRIRVPEPGLGAPAGALTGLSNRLESIWIGTTQSLWNHVSRVAGGDFQAVAGFISPLAAPGNIARAFNEARAVVNDMAVEDEF